jgi:hypothetical protein
MLCHVSSIFQSERRTPVMAARGGVLPPRFREPLRMAPQSVVRSSGAETSRGVRATAPIANICCQKIHGCSYRETTRLTAQCSRCNIRFVSSRERKFGLVLRPARCKFVRDRGGVIQ